MRRKEEKREDKRWRVNEEKVDEEEKEGRGMMCVEEVVEKRERD